MSLNNYCDKLTRLRIGRVGSHEKPHKPVLLLAIISMVETGRLDGNRITYGPDLYALFKKYFAAVKTEHDAINMRDPFWRLRTDGLIEHCANAGFEASVDADSNPPTVGRLQKVCSHSALPADFYNLLQDPDNRKQFRQTLVERYFASKAAEVEQIICEEQDISAYARVLEEMPNTTEATPDVPADPIRSQAFRRVVLLAYDYRCAACGLRIILDDLVLAEAAHLIPYATSHDDDPRNGMALCKNHHWAMDRNLIAPTTDLAWRISVCLDDRIEGQKDLIDLNGRSVILPKQPHYRPKAKSLQWREQKLAPA
jgi:putative restriction endonuclease